VVSVILALPGGGPAFLGILRLQAVGVYRVLWVEKWSEEATAINGGGQECPPYMIEGSPTSRKARDVGHPAVMLHRVWEWCPLDTQFLVTLVKSPSLRDLCRIFGLFRPFGSGVLCCLLR
jgi:hypothetical protein